MKALEGLKPIATDPRSGRRCRRCCSPTTTRPCGCKWWICWWRIATIPWWECCRPVARRRQPLRAAEVRKGVEGNECVDWDISNALARPPRFFPGPFQPQTSKARRPTLVETHRHHAGRVRLRVNENMAGDAFRRNVAPRFRLHREASVLARSESRERAVFCRGIRLRLSSRKATGRARRRPEARRCPA